MIIIKLGKGSFLRWQAKKKNLREMSITINEHKWQNTGKHEDKIIEVFTS
jgi:hypothetical protein